MIPMLLGSELLWWTMFFVIYGTGLMAAIELLPLLPLPTPLAVVCVVPMAVIAMIVVTACLCRLLPSLRAGVFGKDAPKMHLAWGLRYLLVRVLFLGPMLPFIQYSLFLRWFAWRALGARVEFGAMMSSDIPLPDMPLVQIGRGAVIGSRSRLSTHLMMGGSLTLGQIRIGRSSVVGADCNISPDVRIGARSILSYGVLVAGDTTIGDDVFIGKLVRIGSMVTIGNGAVVETEGKVPNGTVIPAGARWVNPKEERSVGRLVDDSRADDDEAGA